MEIKKSNKANLEDKRTTGFLLGLVVVLALLFVALEYTDHGNEIPFKDGLEDEWSQEMELMPAMEQQDMVATAPTPPQQVTTSRVKAVDAVSEQMERQNQITDMRLVGEGETTDEPQTDTQAMSPVAVDETDNPLHFRVVEQLPEFPGGMVELMKWLSKNLKYPPLAQKQKIQGRVVVAFIINKDGSIADAKVVSSIDPQLDGEAMRVVRMMPHWKPGINNNQPCRTMFAIPVVFKL